MGILDVPGYSRAQSDLRYPPTGRVAAPPVAGSGPYDPRTNTYNLKPKHLFRTRAKMAAADLGSGYCRIAAVGDSLTAGDKATRVGQDSWPVVLRKALATQGRSVGGTGLVLAHYADSGRDARWASVGTWAPFTFGGNRTPLYQSGSGASLTLTSDAPGTIVDVYFSNLSTGFTVSIDGGTAVAVAPPGGSTIGTYTVTGLTDATHTVTITGSGGTIYIVGAQVRRSSGVLVSTLGLGGATASQAAAGGLDYGLMNVTANQVTPDLVTIGYMTNEAFTSVSAADYTTAMQVLIDKFKSTSDIVLIAAPTSSLNVDAYRAALYSLADTNDLPIIDMLNRWPSRAMASTYGLQFTDNVHLTSLGYAEYGRSVFNALGL